MTTQKALNEVVLPMKLDIQFFAKQDWSKFRNEVEKGNFAEIVEPIFKRLDEIDQNTDLVTEEEIEKFAAEIEATPIPENYKESFLKKLKVFENRLSRAFPDDFGAILKHYRTAANLSLRDLEAMTGVTASYIQRIEAGKKRAPGIVVINKLSKALEADLMGAILSGKNSTSDSVPSVQELIIKTPFSINDKKADFTQKEALIKIINIALNKSFEENKTEDTLELLFAAMELRKSLE